MTSVFLTSLENTWEATMGQKGSLDDEWEPISCAKPIARAVYPREKNTKCECESTMQSCCGRLHMARVDEPQHIRSHFTDVYYHKRTFPVPGGPTNNRARPANFWE